MQNEYILIMRCPDQPGIMAATSQMVLAWEGDIRDAYSYGDDETGIFFLRFHLTVPDGLGRAAMEESLTLLADKLGMGWELHDWQRKARVLIAVSKFDHCLNDLLHRWKIGALDVEIPAVISNHEDVRDLVEWHGIPFHHLPVTRETREQQEARFLELVNGLEIDLVVLARYMQILSPQMCEALSGRCINIHHSFLPSFKGARPYAQAYERGVKIIGATAHYVTPNLDEGPIIEQDVRRVTHATSAREMVASGREIEASVLARAVRWHVEHRVLINGNKTVVFA
ncbi:MAG: formyltetrahydrofolate deformylase [Alphaproteobacteria bacterium]|nr:formyltetrahydrofolate deformylase [Alphaproteobacteria bacterium]